MLLLQLRVYLESCLEIGAGVTLKAHERDKPVEMQATVLLMLLAAGGTKRENLLMDLMTYARKKKTSIQKESRRLSMRNISHCNVGVEWESREGARRYLIIISTFI